MQVRRGSKTTPLPTPSTPETKEVQSQASGSRELTCEQLPPPPQGGHLVPLGNGSGFNRLPAALLAYRVGDFLEFEERASFGEVCSASRAAMALGTIHPLYQKLYVALAVFRQLMTAATPSQSAVDRAEAKGAVMRASQTVKADRALREKQEHSRATYAQARKAWAGKVQRAFLARPRDAMNISAAAKLLGELGRMDEAVRVLRWGLEQFPNDRFARRQLAEILVQAGEPTRSAGSPEHACEAIDEARILKKLSPNDSRPRVIIARALLLRARELMNKGQPQPAVADLRAALAELREEPPVDDLLTLAMIEHSLGNQNESDNALKTYLRQPGLHAVDGKLAEAYAWRGETRLAFQCLEQALEHNIHHSDLCQAAHSPFMDQLRGDARWLPLQRLMNRAPDQLAATTFEIDLP